VLLFEDFSSGEMPPAGWSLNEYDNYWSVNSSQEAGGVAPEALFTWSNSYAESRLISPYVDLTGEESVIIEFKHMVDHYQVEFTIGVATRSNDGEWNTVWSQVVNEDVEATSVSVTVDNEDVGVSDFQFCLYYELNNMNFINYWYVDDVELINVLQNDASISEILVPDFIQQGDQIVKCKLVNFGQEILNSVDVNWQIEGEDEVFTTNFESLNLQSGDEIELDLQQEFQPEPDDYLLKVWCTHVNGLAQDDDPSNDMLLKNVSCATQIEDRLVLIESFSNSDNEACVSFNENLQASLNENSGQYAHIKYPCFITSVDPYYIDDVQTRTDYYLANTPPQIIANSENWNEQFNQNEFDSMFGNPSFFGINANFLISDDYIDVAVGVTPYVTATNVVLHIAIIENTTTGNVGANGETEFYATLMKMLPDANGTELVLERDQMQYLTFDYDMSQTYVEEMEDLSVVVFLQDLNSREVLQVSYASQTFNRVVNNTGEFDFSVYPNPASSSIFIEVSPSRLQNLDFIIIDTQGGVMKQGVVDGLKGGLNLVDIADLTKGVYFVIIKYEDQPVYKKLIIN
jgi:hypothetical protein